MTPIIILCGFSASGKDSIAREIEKKGFHFILSTTSRPQRDYESEGNPYHFLPKEDFVRKMDANEFIEVREYHTLVDGVPDAWFYGVHSLDVSYDKPNVVVLDIVGLREFKEHFGDNCLSFFVDASYEERKNRCIKRGDYDESEFTRRWEDDKKCFPSDVIVNETNYRMQSTSIENDTKTVLLLVEEHFDNL